MEFSNLLYATEFPITDKIVLKIPTLDEIINKYGEGTYYKIITAFTSIPMDYMVELDDKGIDYEEIPQFEFFRILFQAAMSEDSEAVSEIFFCGVSDLNFRMAFNEDSQKPVLYNKQYDIEINEHLYNIIGQVICKVHFITKNNKQAGNAEAKSYLIELERRRRKRKLREQQQNDSFLNGLIISFVNTEQFPYNYQSIMDISIYQFMSSVKQIQTLKNFDQTVMGVYSHALDGKSIDWNKISWL